MPSIIQEAHTLIFARLNAMIDGFGGTYVRRGACARRDDREENSEADDRAHADDQRNERGARPADVKRSNMTRPPTRAASTNLQTSLTCYVVAACFRRRIQPSNPPHARIRPGMPAPTTGPGTAAADCPLYTLVPGGGTTY